MELDQVFELTKTAIRKNLAKWAYKDEPALLEALEAIEAFQASQPTVQADAGFCECEGETVKSVSKYGVICGKCDRKLRTA